MINWFKSLSKTVRVLFCVIPLVIGGGLTLLYASYKSIALLVFSIIFYVVFLFFLSLNGITNQRTGEEAENKFTENGQLLSAQAEKEGCKNAAALIAAGDIGAIKARVKELDSLMIPDAEIAHCKDVPKKQELMAQNLKFVIEKRDLLRYLVSIEKE